MLRFALLATLAFCLTEAAPGGYWHAAHGGYARAAPHNGDEASVNKNNAVRQLNVNSVANHVGSGSGTANYDGVPGTYLGRTGHNYHHHGHGSGYGHAGYGAGHGYGYGSGYGSGYGAGYGTGYGTGYGSNYGHGYGKGYGRY